MIINARNIERLRKEISWLPDRIPSNVTSFNVKIFDLETLNLSPKGRYYDRPTLIQSLLFGFGGLSEWFTLDRIMLVDAEGNDLGEVGQTNKTSSHRKWSWKKLRFEEASTETEGRVPESVREAILRYSPGSDKTRYVLSFNLFTESNLVVYKVPKKMPDLQSWIDWLTKRKAENTRALQDLLSGETPSI